MEFIHCIMHRQAARNLEREVQKVLQDVINVVSCVKTRPLNSRIFAMICNDMERDWENLLYQAEVCW